MESFTSLKSLLSNKRVVALTGAGCSTESGIPDYRGPNSRPRKPIQYQQFIRSEHARKRYWARSSFGWTRIKDAAPNAGHRALAQLEAGGRIAGVITQNVDGLHAAAGSRDVVELHGSLSAIKCLDCGRKQSRNEFQQRLRAINSDWLKDIDFNELDMAPDGDAEVEASYDEFMVPDCMCGGILKPDVVFFGENVAADVVQQAWNLFDRGDVLLVIGSSLEVFSGRRFVYRAQQEGKPIGIINIGPTRADDVATVKVEGQIGEVLPRLLKFLSTEPV